MRRIRRRRGAACLRKPPRWTSSACTWQSAAMSDALSGKKEALLALSHELGAEHRELAILGEGNTSAKLSGETFLVKASGSSLGTLGAADLVECRSAPLLAMIDSD